MKNLHIASLIVLSASLGACGGTDGSGNLASTPPPITTMSEFTKGQFSSYCDTLTSCTVTVTPLDSSPANSAGTFDTIALHRAVAGGTAQFSTLANGSDLQIKVTPASGTYTLVLNDGSAPKIESSYVANQGFGNRFSVSGISKPAYDEQGHLVSPGGDRVSSFGEARKIFADSRNNNQFDYQWGLRHVSLGVWAAPVAANSATPASIEGSAYYFIHGDRTAASEMPTAGTASYTLAYSEGAELDSTLVSLNADFGARTLAFRAQRPVTVDDAFDSASFGFHYDGFDISGTASIANGSSAFSGPVAGILFHHPDGLDPEQQLGFNGMFNGAFFGPQASELGAVWFAATADGALSESGAFAARKN